MVRAETRKDPRDRLIEAMQEALCEYLAADEYRYTSTGGTLDQRVVEEKFEQARRRAVEVLT